MILQKKSKAVDENIRRRYILRHHVFHFVEPNLALTVFLIMKICLTIIIIKFDSGWLKEIKK